MRPLMADITRCAGTDCDRKDTCARHVTMQYDERGRTYSYGDLFCYWSDDETHEDYFIPIERSE